MPVHKQSPPCPSLSGALCPPILSSLRVPLPPFFSCLVPLLVFLTVINISPDAILPPQLFWLAPFHMCGFCGLSSFLVVVTLCLRFLFWKTCVPKFPAKSANTEPTPPKNAYRRLLFEHCNLSCETPRVLSFGLSSPPPKVYIVIALFNRWAQISRSLKFPIVLAATWRRGKNSGTSFYVYSPSHFFLSLVVWARDLKRRSIPVSFFAL